MSNSRMRFNAVLTYMVGILRTKSAHYAVQMFRLWWLAFGVWQGVLLSSSGVVAEEVRTSLGDGDQVFLLIEDDAAEVPIKFLYSGEVVCSARMLKLSATTYVAVAHGRGFKIDGEYVYPCDDVIRRAGGFLGREHGWELNNSEWRFVVDRPNSMGRVTFQDTTLGEGQIR